MKEEEGSLEPGTETGGEPRAAKVRRALEGPAGDLASLLRSSLKFSQAQLRASDLEIEEIVLTGGVGRLQGLAAYLGRALQLPVSVYDPTTLAGEALTGESLAALKDDGPAAATAVGLAATSAGGDRDFVALRLLPGRIERRRQFLQHQLFVLLAAGIAFLSAGLWYAIEANNRDVQEVRAVTLRQEADDLQALETSLRQAIEERRGLLETRSSWESVIEPGKAIAEVFSALRKNVPADAYLTGVTMPPRLEHGSPPTIVVAGRIRESTESVSTIYAAFADALRELPGFAFTTTNLDHDDDGSGLEFSFELEYRGAPTALAPEDPDPEE
jgi:Tfp pilus assembly protein PilN